MFSGRYLKQIHAFLNPFVSRLVSICELYPFFKNLDKYYFQNI
nr:MAG TPA_asm: hypothetical protein [Caudoviricetes sp.]